MARGTIWDQGAFGGGGAQPPVASAQSGGRNPFFQPGSTYGAPSSWNTTPVAGAIREQNPQLAFAQYGQNLGIADTDSAFNQWFYQQFPRFNRGYGLATLENPMLRIDDFLATLPGLQALQQQYNMASPAARGLSYGTNAPIVRWINR